MAHPQPDDLFNILPHQPGLLGQPLLPPIPQQGGRSDNPFSRLLGVQQGPNEQSNRGNALIAAGSSLADDPGSFVGGVGRAIGAGQAVGQGLDQQDQDSALQARMAELAENGQLVPMFFQALATGKNDVAKTIGTFLNAQRGGSQQGLITVSPGTRVFDPQTREEVFANPAKPTRPPGLGSPQKIIGEDGRPTLAAWDPQAGRFVDTGARPVPDVSAQQMGLFADGLEEAGMQIDALAERGYTGPNIWEQVVFDFQPGPVRNALQGFLSPEAQAFNTSTQRYLEFFLRPVTGARIADEEVRRGQFLFIVMPGDTESTIRLKSSNRRSFTNAMLVRAQKVGTGQVRKYETTKEAFDAVFGVDNQFAIPTGSRASFEAPLNDDEELSVEDAREESRRRFGRRR